MPKIKIEKGKSYDPAVLWVCRMCGGYNLHPIEWNDFDCVHCGVIYPVLFDEKNEKEG